VLCLASDESGDSYRQNQDRPEGIMLEPWQQAGIALNGIDRKPRKQTEPGKPLQLAGISFNLLD
jgi:hypothetical protein